jgi:hypothetical protein
MAASLRYLVDPIWRQAFDRADYADLVRSLGRDPDTRSRREFESLKPPTTEPTERPKTYYRKPEPRASYHTEDDKRRSLERLIRHRIAVRAISQRPELIGLAAAAHDRVGRGYEPTADHADWKELLRGDPAELARLLVSRSDRMERLRATSPFMLLAEHGLDFSKPEERRQVIDRAKRITRLSSRDDIVTKPKT